MLKRKLNIAFVLIFLVLGAASAFGMIQEKVQSVIISERIILNTDRKVYIAGENMLFSLFLIDTKANSLANYPSIGYVILRNPKGETLGKSQVKINKGKASGAIYLSDTLHSGYYQVVAYTNFMRNGSSEIFFKSQVLIGNRFDKDFFDIISQQNVDAPVEEFQADEVQKEAKRIISVIPEKSTYNKREKVALKLNLTDSDVKFSDLSVSVVEKNRVEEQLSKIRKSATVRKATFFNISENGEPAFHLAENRHGELMGRLTDANRGESVGYHVLYLSSPDTVTNFEYAVTDARGYFRFPLPDYYSGKDLFIKVKQREGESLTPKIILDSKFHLGETFTPQPWLVDSSMINYLRNSQDIVRVQKSFSIIQSQYQPLELPTSVPYLYKVPDQSVKPADYVDLKDFVEIAREILPALKIRKREQDYFAEILDIKRRQYLPNTPVIFLDGVIIDDINQVMSFGSKELKRIDMITSRWIVDHQEMSGVLSIYSHNNLWKNVALNKNNLRIKADSYYETPKLFNPNYSIIDSQSREPDFRQLLYWNPGVHLNSGDTGTVEFYTSDYATSYLIKVSGVNDKGEKVETYREIEVIDNF